MNYEQKTARGFSLVEAVIVVAVIAIMTGVLFVRNNNSGDKEIQTAAREIVAQLRILQNDALNGKVINGKIVCACEMYIDTNLNTYETRYYECPYSVGNNSLDEEKKTFTPKKSKLLIGSIGIQTGSITFLVPTGEAISVLPAPNGAGSQGFFLQSEKNPDLKMTICVNSRNIEEMKGDSTDYCPF